VDEHGGKVVEWIVGRKWRPWSILHQGRSEVRSRQRQRRGRTWNVVTQTEAVNP